MEKFSSTESDLIQEHMRMSNVAIRRHWVLKNKNFKNSLYNRDSGFKFALKKWLKVQIRFLYFAPIFLSLYLSQYF